MSTVTDELLLRIAVIGGAVAAEEVGMFEERIGAADVAASKATKSFGLMRGMLRSFGAIGAGMLLYDAVKQFASFTSQMEMLHTQTGATQGEVTRATKAIMGMAIQVGTGPNSLAQALYHIESTQKRGAQAYQELKIAAEGAQVGQANLVDVTNALNAVLVGKLIPATGGFSAAMGQLNATVGSGDMYMQDLASAYSTGILASMKRVGLQLIDINAAMATLGDNNIRGTQAANRLRMGLLQVVKPTAAAADELKKFGMGAYQLAEDYYKPNGLYVMLKDLHTHLDGLSKTKQNDVLMTLFGRGRMSAGIMTLYDQMSRLQSKYVAIADGAKHFGSAWQATTKTFQFFMNQVKAFVDVELIKLGAEIAKAVGWIKDLVRGFEQGKTWAYAITAGIIGLAMAFGGLQLATMAWGAAMMLLENIPIILLISAIAFGIIELIKHWKQVKEAGADALNWIVQTAETVWNWIKGHWPQLLEILLLPFTLMLAPLANVLHTTIPKLITGFVSWVGGIFHGRLFKELTAPIQEWWKVVSWVFDHFVKVVEWVVSHTEHLFSHLGKAMLGPLGSIASAVGHFGSGAFNTVTHLMGFKADGGPVGTSGAYVVGERGPEVVYLPRGSNVVPNHMLGMGGQGQPLEATVVIYNQLDGKTVSKQMVRQGLMATARRGAGGPTFSDAG